MNEEATCLQQTPEGGFIVVGTTESTSYGITRKNIWVVKLSASGKVLWQKSYVPPSPSVNPFVQTTRDNGYIITGERGDGVNFGTSTDLIGIKLDANGNTRWHTLVCDPDNFVYHSAEYGRAVQQTSDGGYIFTGVRSIFWLLEGSNYLIPNQSGWDRDLFIFKTDSLGNGKWGGQFGGDGDDQGQSIQETPDGGFIVAGYTDSFGAGDYDAYVLKFGNKRNLEWEATYGGKNLDQAHEVRRTADGGYIVSGPTKSFGAGDYDVWLLKLDGKGRIRWQKTYGGSKADYGHSVYPTTDGGFILAGSTSSFGSGNYDCWVLKLDAKGTILWEKTYGGEAYDGAFSVRPLKTKEFVVAGKTRSLGAGGYDALVMKLAENGNIDASCGSFIKNSKATVLKGKGEVEFYAGHGGLDSFSDWRSFSVPLTVTKASNTVICKK